MTIRSSLLMTILSAVPAYAQMSAMADEYGDCGSWVQCGSNAHAILNQMYDDGTGLHEDCLICVHVGDDEPLPWTRCHAPCEFAANDKDLYESLLEAIRSRQYTLVASTALRIPRLASFNAARSSLQIMSCDGGNLIGNVPMPADVVAAALEAQLTDRSQKLANRETLDHAVAYQPRP